MNKLAKSRLIIFIMGVILIISAFATPLLMPKTHDKLTADISYLPEGVHIPININTADADTLCLLDNIGTITAQRIIAYREENGNFETIEDIMNVYGIGEKTFESIKNYICAE